MRYARKGLRGLGLCFLAVLGLMAFAVSGAQGQLAGKFLDAGGELAVGTTFTGAQEGNGSLLIPKLNLAIECAASDFEEGKVTAKLVAVPHTPGTAHATIKLLGCVVKTAALAALPCHVEGGSYTAKYKLLAMLASAADGEVPFVLAETLTAGQPIAVIKILNAVGKFCSISGTYNLTGTIAYKVLAGLNNPQLLIPYANQALLGDELLLGTNPMVVDKSFTIEITGPEAGLIKAPFGVC